MNASLTRCKFLAIVLAGSLICPAGAATLYKVVDSDGAVAFTDVPPPPEANVVSQTPLGETTVEAKPIGMPKYEISVTDEAVSRANVRVDLAEHALALARRDLWSPHDGLSLVTERTTSGDLARVDFYKRDVQIARQELMDLLRQRPANALVASL